MQNFKVFIGCIMEWLYFKTKNTTFYAIRFVPDSRFELLPLDVEIGFLFHHRTLSISMFHQFPTRILPVPT